MMDTNDYRGYSGKPSFVGKVRNQMRETTCGGDGSDFVWAIEHGYAWMPAVMSNGMTRAHWVSQQLIGLDFDNKDDKTGQRVSDAKYLTIADAIARLFDAGITPLCAYETYSSAPGWQRFRIVIMLEEPCEDPDVMELAIGRLLALFPEADRQCKDLVRIFFGAPQREGAVGSFAGDDFQPTDIRDVLALPAPASASVEKHQARRLSRKPASSLGGKHVDLDRLKDETDLLGIVQADTGEPGFRAGRTVKFHDCPICGHHDCFVYYSDNNSWACFSTSNTTGKQGGTAIDYVMARDGVSAGQAIATLSNARGVCAQ